MAWEAIRSIRPLPFLALLAGCAQQPYSAPEIAARMPELVYDERRQGGGDPTPDFLVRYASPSGNRTALYLTPDPALAGFSNGAPEDVLRPHLQRANRALGTELLRRGEVPGLARVRARSRLPGSETTCIIAPVSEPPSLEAICLAIVSGQAARAWITVGGIRGSGRDRTIYAAHMAVRLFGYLSRAAPQRPAAGDVRATPAQDSGQIFPEREAPPDPALEAAPDRPGR
ncbi:hypothetical protein [Roseomonas indoligenes]|uniref:Uncharacterized protein n=1 Tax=Roseomonas indoligenes TaxID=2820811 RepID=A0A940MWS2_9PROT|nr:hypothetical protein [Pararoseomonas indoligenes]MBP0492435.1 hypothetical protein [Pararoseomonas indoligenes]